MRIVYATAMIVMLVGPVYAQEEAPIPKYGEAPKEKTQQEKNADKETERAYQRSLGHIPDKGQTDPWGTVRSNDASSAAAKTPTSKKLPAKPGSAAN